MDFSPAIGILGEESIAVTRVDDPLRLAMQVGG